MSNILLLGDSITFGAWDEEGGWADRLRKEAVYQNYQHNFNPYYEIYNLGIPGNTSTDVLERFDEVKRRITTKDDSIIISIGINDSQKILHNDEYKVPQDIFKANIVSIIQKSKSLASKLILIGLTTVDNEKAKEINWLIDCEYRNEYAKIYNSILQDISIQYTVPFIDIYSLFQKKMEVENLFIKDGIHPNTKGHTVLYEAIRSSIFN